MEKNKNTHCKWCSAYGCSNSKNKRPELSFLRFPSDPDRCKKWVVNTRRADLLSTPVEALSKAYYLCAEHFEPSCFTEASPNRKRTRLTKLADPTIFNIPNPPPQLSSSRPPPKQRAPIAVATSTPVTNKLKSSSTTCPSTSTVCNEDALNLSCKSMKRKLEQERVKTSRLRKRLRISCDQAPQNETNTQSSTAVQDDAIQNLLEKHLPEAAVQFILTQIRISKLHANGRRWTGSDKGFAISVHHASRKAYSLLQQVFFLPSPKTLRISLQNRNVFPGFCRSVLDLLKIKVDSMSPCDKVCVICFDEVSIKKSLSYDPVNEQS
ncbi:THAP domain-containing protein 1 [Plakobranchus ocellatus]|uniref:THAP domain-containing protein 1 n=1 Tax=Plakobranchus ocellatus TaxID=259542 RepID=A0AAV3XTX8_9GAST|nr:THAP domain-containing protein 1 [Plakobranchus ocellatus]